MKDVLIPQFEFNQYLSHAFWAIIAFCITFLFVKYLIFPIIEKRVNKRERNFDHRKNELEKKKEEIEELSASYNKKILEIELSIEKIKLEENLKLSKEKREKLAEINDNFRKLFLKSEAEFNNQFEQAKKDLLTNEKKLVEKICEKFLEE